MMLRPMRWNLLSHEALHVFLVLLCELDDVLCLVPFLLKHLSCPFDLLLLLCDPYIQVLPLRLIGPR